MHCEIGHFLLIIMPIAILRPHRIRIVTILSQLRIFLKKNQLVEITAIY
jgi:hypothetical protein